MLPPVKRWQVESQLRPEARTIRLGYHPIIDQILYLRGYTTPEAAEAYLKALDPENIDPFGMLGMQAAMKRICHAIQTKEQVAVYGDYDADGVTATALLTLVLRSFGANVLGYIPNRFDEGYGVNTEALDNLVAQGVRLVITVDCGIRSPLEAEYARLIGLDLIITDHHQPASELPSVEAIINPKQPDDRYPEKDLAGVGLAYKLAQALYSQFPALPGIIPPVESYLDLVAIGTVADLAPLTGENRALVRRGLNQIRLARRQGLRSLIGVSGLNPEKITAGDIGFVLAPRINAAGRLESALAALELLTSDIPAITGVLAQKLDDQNRDRQKITQEIQQRAEETVLAKDPNALLLFAADPDFNKGVVGLAASRLTEKYYRPAIVAQIEEQFTRASCRSIPEFHITQALDECADLLEHHGGHAAAAGFTVRNENLEILIERLRAIAARELGSQSLSPTLKADLELPLRDLQIDLYDKLDWLQPTGIKNPQAVFVTRNLSVLRSRTVGKDHSHLKLTVRDQDGIAMDAIAFRQGHHMGQLPGLIDLMYTFEINEFNGNQSFQLNVRDLKPAGIVE